MSNAENTVHEVMRDYDRRKLEVRIRRTPKSARD